MSILECKNITKVFSGTVAVDNVDFKVEKAHIHALLGENGAGKSTLSSIIAGLQKQTSGEVYFENELVHIKNPSDAKKLGIAIMTQEVDYCQNLSVAANIFLGDERMKHGALDWKFMNSETQKVLDRLGVAFKATDKAKELSVSQKQQMQLARVVYSQAKLIIMDEPTSSLTEHEVDVLFDILRTMRAEGISIIYISHRMEEIFRLADMITVLRDGKKIGTKPLEETSVEEVIGMIIGEKQSQARFERSGPVPDETVMEVKNLEQENGFSDINFRLRAGEVLGIFGLRGAGAEDLIQALFGLTKKHKGEILIGGKKKGNGIRSSVDNKIVFIPSNRREEGILKTMSVRDNMLSGSLEKISKFGSLNFRKGAKTTEAMVEKLEVSCSGINQRITQLSGGNQQKVIVGRCMLMDTRVVLIFNPTRGIDVGAKIEIYKIIRELSESGLSVIITSSEISDVLSVCDRVLVMQKGQVQKEFEDAEINEENLLQAALSTTAG